MKLKLTTSVIIIIVTAAFVYDAVAAYLWGEPGTISANWWMLSHKWPILPFLLGVVMGHLNWQGHGRYDGTEPPPSSQD